MFEAFVSLRSRYTSELYLYVEKFDQHNKCILVDFVDSNEFVIFDLLGGFNYNWQEKPTMLEICNYTQRRLQEGTVYRVSREVLSGLVNRMIIVEDSFVVGFSLELKSSDPQLFQKSKSFSEFERFERNIEQFTTSTLDFISPTTSSHVKVVVRNVGQGSWNEIYNSHDECKMVYDLGTIYTTSKTKLLSLIGNRNGVYQRDKPALILSHWDVDHYHFLLALDDATIKAFSLFVYRGIIPNLTARKALGRFISLGATSLSGMPPESPPQPKKSSDILKTYYYTFSKDVLLFNGSSNRSRNKSGIGLAIRRKNSSIVFSSDLNYSQVSNYILPTLNYPCNHYLVVPNHGGNAGNFIYSCHKETILKDAVVSVGTNPYKPRHPFSKTISDLKKIGFNVVRTDSVGTDIYITL